MMRYVVLVILASSFKLRRRSNFDDRLRLFNLVVSCPKGGNEQVCGGAGECVKECASVNPEEQVTVVP